MKSFPSNSLTNKSKIQIKESSFGKIDNTEIKKIQVQIETGMEFALINYGGIITDILVPDKNGTYENICLSYDELEEYIADKHCIGGLIGRYANRIKNGEFRLGDNLIRLTKNSPPHHLHGGFSPFHKVIWNINSITNLSDSVEIVLSHFSPDGSDGYPGNLDIKATFSIYKNRFDLKFEAESERDTIINPSQHTYFNLSGTMDSNLRDHSLMINSDRIVEVNQFGIPSGLLLSTKNSKFDFKVLKHLGEEFDHCWVLNKKEPQIILEHQDSGRRMTIATESPGVQVYTANLFDGSQKGRGGKLFQRHNSICLEPQHLPDSPNNPSFPSTFLRKGEKFSNKSTYTFDCIKKGL